MTWCVWGGGGKRREGRERVGESWVRRIEKGKEGADMKGGGIGGFSR